MKAKCFYKVHLSDEMPRIGLGHRIIFVHSIGRKYVKVRSLGNLRGSSVQRVVWDKVIARTAEPVKVPKILIKASMRCLRSAGYKITKSQKELLK